MGYEHFLNAPDALTPNRCDVPGDARKARSVAEFLKAALPRPPTLERIHLAETGVDLKAAVLNSNATRNLMRAAICALEHEI